MPPLHLLLPLVCDRLTVLITRGGGQYRSGRRVIGRLYIYMYILVGRRDMGKGPSEFQLQGSIVVESKAGPGLNLMQRSPVANGSSVEKWG